MTRVRKYWSVLERNRGRPVSVRLPHGKSLVWQTGEPSAAIVVKGYWKTILASLEKLGGANQLSILLGPTPDVRALFSH